MFQSLTGSIHTRRRLRFLAHSYMFQSLTGSIHTIIPLYELYAVGVFQSLTGSIHTLAYDGENYVLIKVSIPHRFNSHRCSFLVIFN